MYTATAAPGSAPDGVDQNNNPVSVWTLNQVASGTGGGSGAYLGSAGGSEISGWQIWSSPYGTGEGNGGLIDASTAFSGGALSIGQTVSINFEMSATYAGDPVGVSLLNGSGNAITFGIFGGEPGAFPFTGNGYWYSDAGTSYGNAGSMGYQYQSPFNIAFTITGAGTYSAIAGSDSWSGTYSGSLIGMDVFNDAAEDGSDVGFNNLTVTAVPEPGMAALVSLAGMLLFGYQRRNRGKC